MSLGSNTGDAGVFRFQFEKAERALSAACILITTDNPGGVCDRAYYAMFDAAHAALLAVSRSAAGDTSIKTHAGMVRAFHKRFILTGLIDDEHGRALNQVNQLRQRAEGDDPLTIDDAALAFDQAHAFLAAIRAVLLPKETPAPPP
jgi:uncharacterized protein (UPF0332 family)